MQKKKNHKTTQSHTAHSHLETEDDIQKSIARALLGIISISIFLAFFLIPQ